MVETTSLLQKVNFTTPEDVLTKSHAKSKVNRYTLYTPELELESTKVNFKLFTVDKSTLWSVAKKVVIIASLSIAVAAVFTAALTAPHLVFPVMFGLGLVYYKLHPKVLHPMEINYQRAVLKKSNLESIIEKQKSLKAETKQQLHDRFEKLGINTKNYKIDPNADQTLTESEALTILVPLLARFEHWKEQVDETEKVQNHMLGRIQEIRDRVKSDDSYSLTAEEALELEAMIEKSYEKLKELSAEEKDDSIETEISDLTKEIHTSEGKRKLSDSEKTELINELVSLTYRVEDLDEDDSLNMQINSRLLSSIKASYTLNIMHDLTQKEMVNEHGTFNSHLKHVREALNGTSTGDDYFITKSGENVTFKWLKSNVRDFDSIREKMFNQAKSVAKEESA